jgi:hypothetical protein
MAEDFGAQTIAVSPDRPAIEGDRPRRLSPAQPGHLLHVAPHQAPRRPTHLSVLLFDRHPLHPTIKLLAVFGLKTNFLGGRDKTANRFQTQLLCIVHADDHYPA